MMPRAMARKPRHPEKLENACRTANMQHISVSESGLRITLRQAAVQRPPEVRGRGNDQGNPARRLESEPAEVGNADRAAPDITGFADPASRS